MNSLMRRLLFRGDGSTPPPFPDRSFDGLRDQSGRGDDEQRFSLYQESKSLSSFYEFFKAGL
jgi:hypothetical protein